VTRRLIEGGVTIATAESCTGGMLGELLTRMPGSSKTFVGGAITYSDAEKVRQLGVTQATLDAHGAVSEQTAEAMAEGARGRFKVDYAVAITGIAGPDGALRQAGRHGVDRARRRRGRLRHRPDRDVRSDDEEAVVAGARDQIRLLSAWWALKLLDDALDRRDQLRRDQG